MPLTPPDDLLRDAQRLDAEADRLELEARKKRNEAAFIRYVLLGQKQEAASAGKQLTPGKQPRKLKPVTAAHKAAISGSLLGITGGPDWMLAARKAGYPSLRDIAAAMGVHHSFLSNVKAGRKTMPEARARKFEALTGYPASKWQK